MNTRKHTPARISVWPKLTLTAQGLTIALLLGTTAVAQNLLTNNPGFEAGVAYYTPGWGWPLGSPGALPGWVITLDSCCDGYAGTANNQQVVNLEGTNFAYIYSGNASQGRMETAPENRAAVSAGVTYTLWFRARNDAAWGPASATFSLVWFPNWNNWTTVGSPTTEIVPFPAKIEDTDPLIEYHITAQAPPGAHCAGVQVTRPAYNYEPVIFDDFVLMAEPLAPKIEIKNKQEHIEISWPRSVAKRLEQSSTPKHSGFWTPVDKPVHTLGATSKVEYPIEASVRFFRLADPD